MPTSLFFRLCSAGLSHHHQTHMARRDMPTRRPIAMGIPGYVSPTVPLTSTS